SVLEVEKKAKIKLQLIGEGGYGQVYKAINQHNGQIAAVKVIKMDQMYDDNELEFMQNVNHHNVTNLIEIYYWDKQLYVFMEICGGGSLFGLCYKTGPLTEQEIAYVTTECLQGLHNMHLRGYMHRDIKLKNILLTDAGEVKICDFGLVEKMENKTHEVVGTVMIRAPEVSMAEERGSYDERCDIWSLGISLLYLAESMSHLTFESDTIYQIWITNTKNNWSEDFKSFVRAALIVDPARRPTAEEEQKRLRTSCRADMRNITFTLNEHLVGKTLAYEQEDPGSNPTAIVSLSKTLNPKLLQGGDCPCNY
uniref:non-specific serine/threonine protein kinase n=1 Tax=Denticeps clupeoides TaxID=299321 RepID=A0AAY3ZUP3_9TELE